MDINKVQVKVWLFFFCNRDIINNVDMSQFTYKLRFLSSSSLCFYEMAQQSHMCGSKKTSETVNFLCRLVLFIAAADRAAFLHDI